MKKLLILTTLFSLSAFAQVCPKLQGQYHCMLSNGQYSLLTIAQKNLSLEPELEEYSFDYSGIAGDPDVFNASQTGEPDSWGWITKCAKDRLKSIPVDGSTMVEMYLDSEKAFVYAERGTPVLRCPKKL